MPISESLRRDRYNRPIPLYNKNYDPIKLPPIDLPKDYSPFVYLEPLFDDRPIVIANLLAKWSVIGAAVRPRTQWV